MPLLTSVVRGTKYMSVLSVFKAIGWGLKTATSLPGMAAIGYGAHVATDGRSTDAVLDKGGELAGGAFRSATGIDANGLHELMEDFENGDWAGIAQNPMLIAGAALATFGMSKGLMGNGLIDSAINALMVAGVAYVAQKFLMPAFFGEKAENPAAPTRSLTTQPEPATQAVAPRPELPEPS